MVVWVTSVKIPVMYWLPFDDFGSLAYAAARIWLINNTMTVKLAKTFLMSICTRASFVPLVINPTDKRRQTEENHDLENRFQIVQAA